MRLAAGLLALGLGCGGREEPPGAPPDPAPSHPDPVLPGAPGPAAGPVDAPRAPVDALWRRLADAELRLPERPPPAEDGRFPLDGPWGQPAPGIWTTPSPIRFPHAQYRAAPPGTALTSAAPGGGPAVLPYADRLAEDPAPGDPGWEVQAGQIWVRAGAAPSGLVLRHEAAAADARRRHPGASGLPPAAFAAWEGTLGAVTRACVLLPAPAQARWTLDAAPGSQLRFAVGMPPRVDLRRRGAARARVWVDGVEAWSGDARTGEAWQEAAIPLDGGARELRVEVEALGGEGSDELCLAEPTVSAPPRPGGPRRVVVVGIDTLRPDRLGVYGHNRATTPTLDALAAQSVTFDRAWAPAPRTRPSFRTLWTGRWPLDAIGAPTLAERLAPAGVRAAGIVANVHLLPHLGFSAGSGRWAYHDSADAGPQVDRALSWLQAHAQDDALLFLHLMDPHVFYIAPDPWFGMYSSGLPGAVPDRFNRWTVAAWEEQGRLTDASRAFIAARYDEQLRAMDQELGRLVAALDALPGDTVLVLTSDHGEELWEHGGFEHNHSLHDEVTRALLWIRPPRGRAGRLPVHAPASLADVVPTVEDLLGVGGQGPPVDGLSLRPLVDDPAGQPAAALRAAMAARPLPLGHLMFAPEVWGVVVDTEKYLLWTASGEEALYRLDVDPGERQNVVSTLSLDERGRWAAALEAATGHAVGPGWRVGVGPGAAPFTLRFAEPVRLAAVIDPESARERRANLEWGEVPPVRPSDVAEVELRGDELHVRPGARGDGQIAVLGPGRGSAVELRGPGGWISVTAGPQPLGGAPGHLRPGAVLIPRATEAARLAEVGDPEAISALRALGYIE